MPQTPDDIEGGITDTNKVILNNGGLTADNPGEMAFDGSRLSFRSGDDEVENFQRERFKGVDNGYASLAGDALVPLLQLASSISADPEAVLHEDRTFKIPSGVLKNVGFESSINESFTTSPIYSNKLDFTTDDLPAGASIFAIFYWRVFGSQNGTRTEVRLVQNLGEVNELVLLEQEYQGTSPVPNTPFLIEPLVGVNTFDIQWRKSGGGGQAKIDSAVLGLWRIL